MSVKNVVLKSVVLAAGLMLVVKTAKSLIGELKSKS